MPRRVKSIPITLLCSMLGAVLIASTIEQQGSSITVTKDFFHLGDDATPEWPEAAEQPLVGPLELDFKSPRKQGDGEWILLLKQRHVDNTWSLGINGQLVAELIRGGDLVQRHYIIPPGLIHTGTNTFTLSCDNSADDITVGEIELFPKTPREYFRLGTLSIKVSDADTATPLPCRISVVGADGNLPEIYFPVAESIAFRPGVIYPKDGSCTVMIPEGKYTIWASRGMEWGADSRKVTVNFRGYTNATLSIRREVDTTGYVAADTHIHTLTHSGHGDSSVEERQLTLAGEGVELAIATDHNHNIDYRPTQVAMGLSKWYTSVIGNEVSTGIGHFNAFPLNADGPVPLHQGFENGNPEDWVRVVEGMREQGAKVVILNHPRWPEENDSGPFGKLSLDQLTGSRSGDTQFTFDAFELFNSTTPKTPTQVLLRDWFSLLNHGDWIMAVGSSDSHTVGDMVGQGRTYVQSSTDIPSAINVGEACESFINGHSCASLGFFIDALQDGHSVMGREVKSHRGVIEIDVRVAGASWAKPGILTAWLNGKAVATKQLKSPRGKAWDETVSFKLEVPQMHDSWVIFSITGPLPEGDFWYTLMSELAAATNPIRIDGNNDGIWLSPRHTARSIFKDIGIEADELQLALKKVDEAVAVQLFAIVKSERPDVVEDLGGRRFPHYDLYEEVCE